MNAKSRQFSLSLWNCFVVFAIIIYTLLPASVHAAEAQDLPPYAFPRMYVELNDIVSAEFWPLGSVLTLTIDDDIDPNNGYLFQSSQEVTDPTDDAPELGATRFKLWHVDPAFDLVPGQYVTITDGTTTKNTWVEDVTFDYADEGSEMAGGTGPAGLNASVWIKTDIDQRSLDVVIEPDETWEANFGAAGFDIRNVQRTTVDVWEDEGGDGDSTVAVMPLPITFGARPETDEIEGWEWPVHELVTIQIDDPGTGPGPDKTVTDMPSWVEGDPGHTLFTMSFNDYDLKVGDIVTVTNGTTTKQHTVRNLVLTDFDLAADTISGTADPDQLVNPYACSDDICGFREETTSPGGSWVANFAVPGDKDWEDGIVDIRPGSWIDSTVSDDDGDVTQAGMQIPNSSLGVRANWDSVEGWEWAVGDSVDISIDDSETPENPDVQKSAAVQPCDWNPDQGCFQTDFVDDYDIKAGDLVTVSNGTVTKEHVVVNFEITDFDLDAETVSGIAGAGQAVNIWTCWQNEPCVNREETADGDGNWTTNFAVPGELDWEQDTANLRGGSWIDSSVYDEDGDSTMFGQSVPNPSFSAWVNTDYIEGYEWTLGAHVDLEIDDPFTADNPDYSDSTTVAAVEWDPNQTWFNFELTAYDIKAGDTVTLSDGTFTKQLDVVNVEITEADLDTSIVSGTAGPNQFVTVSVCGENFCIFRDESASPSGIWSANFAVPGDEGGEDETIDLYGGLLISASIWDGDGDTSVFGITTDWVAPPSIPLVFALSSSVELSVPRATVENISVLNTLNDSLFRLGENGSLLPLAATDYSVSPDGRVYTIILRNDAVWSDGVPVTAQHFVDGILRVLNPNVGSDYGFILYPIQNAQAFNHGDITDASLVGVKALGPQTLEITLEEPTAHFPQILVSPAILPARQDVIDAFGDTWTSPEHYVSSGLYRLVEYDPAHIVVEQNPDYVGSMQSVFSQIAFDVIPDANEQIAAYKNGDVDVLLSTPITTIMNDPDLRQDLTVLPSPGLFYMGLSAQVTPTDDPLVRKALASAIDRQILLDDVEQTPWRVEATGLIPPELNGYQGSAVGYGYDPVQAQAFITQAGYPGGVGFPELNILSSSNQAAIVEEIASQWETVLGITVNVYVPSGGERFEILADCQQNPSACPYHGYILGWFIDYADAYNLLSDLFNPDSPYNYTGWDNAAYQSLIDLAVSESDPLQRIAYLQQAEQILVEEDAAIAPLFHTDSVLVVRPGIFPYYSSNFFTNLAYWSNVDPNGDGMSATVIGSEGGTVATQNNSVSAEVPAGALQDNVTLSVTDLGGNYQITATQEELNVISGFSIQPHGLQFAAPVTLTFAWNDTNSDGIVDETSQFEANIFLLKDGEPITPACGVNPNCNMDVNALTVEVSSLSRFELVIPTHQPPTSVVITAPVDPVAITNTVIIDVSFSDPDDDDPHNVVIDWGDMTSTTTTVPGSTAAATHQYQSAGVYTIQVSVTDLAGEFAQTTFEYVVVYDPDGGFVTGGGWINSPEGAYTADPALTGKATFGFVSKYQRGANVPTGNTEFQFKVGNLNFTSTSYDWLVIAGSKAQYKGTGTINGAGTYGFMLTAVDGAPDKFRIKIWEKATGEVIYDHQIGASDTADPATAIQGGSIVVHKAR